ncbi:hypothetical protein TIFTF001_001562 [Ficus carica]|uniref:Uncharacterized protein n=1 Tax=Ficus carica TaxID=3494 RepID=A0AA87ZIR0_FICCA|nr:hypothetical protein TIFTF001_001562 [Ficus carica]
MPCHDGGVYGRARTCSHILLASGHDTPALPRVLGGHHHLTAHGVLQWCGGHQARHPDQDQSADGLPMHQASH